MIAAILNGFKNVLGEDFKPYLNHARRVYEYALILSLQKDSQVLQIAAAFHDLDIWKHDTMDYLKGSSELALEYIREKKMDVDEKLLSQIIHQHHKLTKIKGNLDAEAFRKADLIDLTGGRVKFNVPKSLIVENERRFPRFGFTKLIIKKAVRWAVKHPFKPFPMIQWT